MDIGLYELSDPIFWRSVFAELVATTFFLFFAVSVVVYRGLFGLDTTQLTSNNYGGAARSGIAFGFGFSIFVLAFVFAPVSGANMNPAVSLGLMLCKKISITRAIVYSLAQMLGASLGTLICKNIDPAVFVAQSGAVNVMAAGVPARGGLLAEFMATMFLVLVVLSAVDESRKHKTLPYVPILAPFAIGTAVVVCHLALVPIDGCSINPARSFGPALVTGSWKDQWVFWVGPALGAIGASILHHFVFTGMNKYERKKRTEEESDEQIRAQEEN